MCDLSSAFIKEKIAFAKLSDIIVLQDNYEGFMATPEHAGVNEQQADRYELLREVASRELWLRDFVHFAVSQTVANTRFPIDDETAKVMAAQDVELLQQWASGVEGEDLPLDGFEPDYYFEHLDLWVSQRGAFKREPNDQRKQIIQQILSLPISED